MNVFSSLAGVLTQPDTGYLPGHIRTSEAAWFEKLKLDSNSHSLCLVESFQAELIKKHIFAEVSS